MIIKTNVLEKFSNYFFCVCLLITVAAAITGCASNPGATAASRNEIVTDSDEPEMRKRARIRLELAVGYFEQGQTTIALDELKQSLAIDSNYGEAYSLRGLIYMQLKDFKYSEESFRLALSLMPTNSNIMHNLGWLLCQQTRYTEAQELFTRALSNPQYGERAKTLMAQGLCQVRAGKPEEAELSFLKSYEFDAGNPITAYNLSVLLFKRGDYSRAQFYVRRLNNSDLANAESLWLGIKVERRIDNVVALKQLASQLLKRFPQSPEATSYLQGNFDE
jgi:type IV pilus assembly protein PilF